MIKVINVIIETSADFGGFFDVNIAAPQFLLMLFLFQLELNVLLVFLINIDIRQAAERQVVNRYQNLYDL